MIEEIFVNLSVFKNGKQIKFFPKCSSDVNYVDTKELKTAFCGECLEKLGSVKEVVPV